MSNKSKLGPNPKTIGVRVSWKMKKAVEKLAEKDHVAISDICKKALQTYINMRVLGA